jgi:hypothetical protein
MMLSSNIIVEKSLIFNLLLEIRLRIMYIRIVYVDIVVVYVIWFFIYYASSTCIEYETLRRYLFSTMDELPTVAAGALERWTVRS